MSDYPAIFHLRVCRAIDELKKLEILLEALHDRCQRDGEEEITSVDLESLTIRSGSLNQECTEAKRAMNWHQERK